MNKGTKNTICNAKNIFISVFVFACTGCVKECVFSQGKKMSSLYITLTNNVFAIFFLS